MSSREFQYEEGTTWRFRLTGDLCLHFPEFDFGRHSFRDEFDREWLSLQGHSLTIRKGYAWDGSSPKFRILGSWIGTPDPEASRAASVVHDALYQFCGLPCFPLTRGQCDEVFRWIMYNHGFRGTCLYYRAVRLFGGLFAARTTPGLCCVTPGH